MAVWLKKTIYFILFIFCLTFSFLIKTSQVQAEGNPDWIIHQPPYYNSSNNKYYVKNNADNIIKFGICGDNGQPAQMSTKLVEGATEIGHTDLAGDYQKLRSDGTNGGESGVNCNNGSEDTEAYGPKTQIVYHPTTTGTKSFTIKFIESDGTAKFVTRDFSVESSDDPESEGASTTSWNPSDVNIANFTNMINITDIFGNRFDLSNQVNYPTPEGLVQKVADVLLILAGILAVIAFIWSGYQFIMSSGDSAKVEKAKKAMISAFIGVVLIIFAYSIIKAVDIFSSPPLSSSIPEAKFE